MAWRLRLARELPAQVRVVRLDIRTWASCSPRWPATGGDWVGGTAFAGFGQTELDAAAVQGAGLAVVRPTAAACRVLRSYLWSA
jgi:hypothetical protein